MDTDLDKIDMKIKYLLYELSEKIIIQIEKGLYKTMFKMIGEKFVSNATINLSFIYYNEIYKCLITKNNINTEIINNLLLIQQIFPYDLLYILTLSFKITIQILNELNRTQYNYTTEDKFISSIETQIELIINLKFDVFDDLIKNHICEDKIDLSDPEIRFFKVK